MALPVAVGLRPELGLAAATLAGVATLRRGPREGGRLVVRPAAIALGLWGIWLLTLGLTVGTIVPTTLPAKRAQSASPFWTNGCGFVAAALEHSRTCFFGHGQGAVVVLAAISLALRCCLRSATARSTRLTEVRPGM